MSTQHTTTTTKFVGGIEVVENIITNMPTYRNRHRHSNVHSHSYSYSSPKYRIVDTGEKKDDDSKMRHIFQKSLNDGKYNQCYRIYIYAHNNQKLAQQIFGPTEEDYSVSLNDVFNFKNNKVKSINEKKFKICWLMYNGIWKKYKHLPIKYVYVSKEQKALAYRLGYFKLLKFIEDHYIQDELPKKYYYCYSSILPSGNENTKTNTKHVILTEFGQKPTTKYFTKYISLIDMYNIPTATVAKGSTYAMFSDNDTTPPQQCQQVVTHSDRTTLKLFEDHQKSIQSKYKGV